MVRDPTKLSPVNHECNVGKKQSISQLTYRQNTNKFLWRPCLEIILSAQECACQFETVYYYAHVHRIYPHTQTKYINPAQYG